MTSLRARPQLNLRALIALSSVVVVALGVAACHSTTEPSVASVTGTWDVTATANSRTLTGVLELTETSGSVSGTLQFLGLAGSATLTGSISSSGEMNLTGSDPSGAQAVLHATLDSARRSFSGTLQLTNATQTGTVAIQGTKR